MSVQAKPRTLYDLDKLRRRLSAAAITSLDELEFFAAIGSTNTYLMQQVGPAPGRFRVALAEMQTAGRGRAGNVWQSPADAGLYLSLAYSFRQAPAFLPAATLALGVAAVSALRAVGVADTMLKWPNDLILHDHKLGGILTEVHSQLGAGVTLVAGIGINLQLSGVAHFEIQRSKGLPATDLASHVALANPGQNLAACMIEQFYSGLTRFEQDGLLPTAAAWPACDWLKNREVRVESGTTRFGIACGINDRGELLLQTDSGLHAVQSGDVRVRPV